MKKLLAFAAVLALCFTAAFAVAEEIPLEQVVLENGLSFPAPTLWTEYPLGAEELAEGYVLVLVDGDTGRMMMVAQLEEQPGATNQDLADALLSDSAYASAAVQQTEYLEMVIYALADQTMVGYCFTDGEGLVYNFAFLNSDGTVLSGDTALLMMAQQCMAGTRMEEPEQSTAQQLIQTESGIPLEMYTIDDLVFALPADWTEMPLTEQEQAEGNLAMLTDEATGHVLLVMASEIEAGFTNAQLAETLGQDGEYAARLLTNAQGQELVQFLTADQSIGGYALMSEDGWMYIFYFSGKDLLTEDAALTQLVSDCMDRICFAE